jgi:WD40 repeat protein
MNRVFISYSRKNEAFAERLARDLSDAGLDVWIDLRQIQGGEIWQQEIFRGLDRTDFVVLCLSPAAIASEWVQREVTTAKNAGKRIYPVMVEESFKQLQENAALNWLTDVQFIRFEGRYESAFPELLQALPGGRSVGTYDVFDAEKIINPFKGLEAFQQRDAAYFFGREDLIKRALTRLRRTRFLAVVGASGSGKSSLVRAGIIPQLRAGVLAGSDKSPVIIFSPGADPVTALAERLHPLVVPHDGRYTLDVMRQLLREQPNSLVPLLDLALTGLPDVSRFIIVIDQFEEAFTRAGEKERDPFIEAIVQAARLEGSRALMIATMRADFFGQLSHYPELAVLFEGDNLLIVTEMTTANLLQAIEGPAKAVGLRYEAGLVDKLLEDVKSQPGSLPLLQYALKELFERRKGALLTLEAYEEIGGVRRALARHAEDIYDGLTQVQQELMRRVLLRLVEVNATGEATRRRVPISEVRFRNVPEAQVQQIIDLLTAAEARLLVASRSINAGGTEPVTWLEVSHEALIREWDRFKGWVATSAEDLRYESELRKAAQDWELSGRDVAYLLTGRRLTRAEIWWEDNDVTPLQHELIETSLATRAAGEQAEKARMARELELQRQSVRRARLAAAIMVVFLLAAVSGALAIANTNAALAQREQELQVVNDQLADQIGIAEENASRARSLAVASSAQQALSDSNGDLALALALTANIDGNTPPEAERTLAEVAFSPGTKRRLTLPARATATDVSFDNTRIAVGLQNGGVLLLDATTGDILQTFEGHASAVTDVAINPDATQLISASNDATNNFILWDIATGQPARQWATYDNQKVNAVTFAGVEPTNATNDVTQIATSLDGTIMLVGTRTGIVRRIVGDVALWEYNHFATSTTANRPRVTGLAISRDGRGALVGFSDGTMIQIDPEAGTLMQTFISLDNGVTGIAFLTGTNFFVATGTDNTVRLWDLVTGRQLQTLDQESPILTMAVSPDGKTVVTGAANSTLRLWDIQGSATVARTEEPFVSGVALSADAGLALIVGGSTTSSDTPRGVVNVRSLADGTQRAALTIEGDSGIFSAVAYSPDGTSLAAGTVNGTLAIWDAATLTLRHTIPNAHGAFILGMAFSNDGRTLATGSADKTVQLWDVQSGTLVRILTQHKSGVTALAFNGDGTRLLSGGTDNLLILWDTTTGAALQEFIGHGSAVRSVALNSAGTLALSGSADNSARVWDTATGREQRRFSGHDRAVNGTAFVPVTDDIVTASADGTVRVWDANTGIEVRRYILTNDRGRTVSVKSVALSGNGSHLLVGLSDNTLRLLLIVPEKDNLIAWVQANRFVRDLNCNEELQFGISESSEQVFVDAGDGVFLSVFDAANNVVASLPQGTPVRLLNGGEADANGRVPVCTLDGVEGLADLGQLAESVAAPS